MTPFEIDNLEPGRALDALVAELVMGLKPVEPFTIDDAIADFHPSGNIADAWLVVEKLRECGFRLILGNNLADSTWDAYFQNSTERIGYTDSDTAPLAICRAALKAIASQQWEVRMVSRLEPGVARMLGRPNDYEPYQPAPYESED